MTVHDLDLCSYSKLSLSSCLCPIPLSGVVLDAPSLSLFLQCFQELSFPLPKYCPIWDLQRMYPNKSDCCEYFCVWHRFSQAREKVCQQMQAMCSASPGPGQEAVGTLEGHQGESKKCHCPSPCGRLQSQTLYWVTKSSKTFWKPAPACEGDLGELPW